jgi:hypothetical protein
MTLRQELAALLEERTLSNWERRKRRLRLIPTEAIVSGLLKARKGEPQTLEEYIGSHLGFLPGERERIEKHRAAEQGER